jgi:hypothetical protein
MLVCRIYLSTGLVVVAVGAAAAAAAVVVVVVFVVYVTAAVGHFPPPATVFEVGRVGCVLTISEPTGRPFRSVRYSDALVEVGNIAALPISF